MSDSEAIQIAEKIGEHWQAWIREGCPTSLAGVVAARTADHVQRVISERDRLAAIVEKLPKTADGVPAVPGMNVWYVFKPESEGVRPGSPHACSVSISRAIESNGTIRLVKSCYSTREAAEAAKGGGVTTSGKHCVECGGFLHAECVICRKEGGRR